MSFGNVFQSLVRIVYSLNYDGIWSSSIPKLSFLINENIFDKCFRISLSVIDPRISPLPTTYKYPQLFLLIIISTSKTKKISRNLILLSHAASFKRKTCFEHSNFFKVKNPEPILHQWRQKTTSKKKIKISSPVLTFCWRTRRKEIFQSNYELFNCNKFNIRYWSWNYRGCWHQTCPPIVPR